MPTPTTSDALTEGIRVTAAAFYMPDESEPENKQFRFGYRITISNEGTQPVRLVSRRWVIIDAEGGREEVEGPGVIGQTPTIEPGQGFKYTSYCPLKTRWGTMEGMYRMERVDGVEITAAIGRFYLVMPREAASVNVNSEFRSIGAAFKRRLRR